MDLTVFESTPALLLEPRFRELAPQARIVYRVSDHIGSPDCIHSCCGRSTRPRRAAISCRPRASTCTASQTCLRRACTATRSTSRPSTSPSRTRTPVGRTRSSLGFRPADVAFLRAAARARPDVTFHVIGQTADVPEQNIVSYGELPFRDTLPFVKHADVGLHTVVYRPGAEGLTDSLKVIQFSYLGLPIVLPLVPGELAAERRHVPARRRRRRRPCDHRRPGARRRAGHRRAWLGRGWQHSWPGTRERRARRGDGGTARGSARARTRGHARPEPRGPTSVRRLPPRLPERPGLRSLEQDAVDVRPHDVACATLVDRDHRRTRRQRLDHADAEVLLADVNEPRGALEEGDEVGARQPLEQADVLGQRGAQEASSIPLADHGQPVRQPAKGPRHDLRPLCGTSRCTHRNSVRSPAVAENWSTSTGGWMTTESRP